MGVCWQSDERTTLIGLGVAGLFCYPVACLSLVCYITWKYPGLIASGQGLLLVRRFCWLFSRFRQQAYFYGVLFLWHGTLLALIPVTFTGKPMEQVIGMASILLLFGGLQSWLRPWRTRLANYSDVGINYGLILCMIGAAFLVDVGSTHGGDVLGEFLLFCVLLTFVV